MSRPAPLLTTPGEVYRRRGYGGTSEDEEDWVDRSLPSTPVDARAHEAGPSRTMRHAMASEPQDSYSDAWSTSQVHIPPPTPSPELKPGIDDLARDGDDDTPLRTVSEADEIGSPATPEEEDEPDDRQCRICFLGAEEEDSMGRLISPCLCTGSMRYVHVQCINAWRGTGTNAKAFMECPQCHHQYRLQRTLVSGLATSKPLLAVLSAISFALVAILMGQLTMVFYSLPLSRASPLTFRRVDPWAGVGTDYWADDDGYDDGTVVYVSGGGLVFDVVSSAISTFSRAASSLSTPKSLPAGIPASVAGIVVGLGARFVLGLSVLGSFSFLSLLLSMSLFAPAQMANGLRGTGWFGSLGRRARARAGAGAGRVDLGQAAVVLFVLIGALNTLRQTYAVVQRLTHWGLKYLETQILEVNPEDRRRARDRRARDGVWWRVWWRERRWKRWEGWREVWVRGVVDVRRRAGDIAERRRLARIRAELGDELNDE